MLPFTHKHRDDVIKYYNMIDTHIAKLKKAKAELNYLLDQDSIIENDLMILDDITDRIDKVKFILGSINDYDNYKIIEKQHPIQSFTPEKTYRRDLSYSLFHRSFSKNCYTLDLDFLEMRKDKKGEYHPVSLYDVKRNIQLDDNLKNWNNGLVRSLKVYKSVADQLEIPLWYVNYKPDMTQLIVSNIHSIEPLHIETKKYSPTKYKYMIENL